MKTEDEQSPADLVPSCLSSAWDPFSDDSLESPYENYRDLRMLGPVVFLSRYNLYALPRYGSTRYALENWAQFTSEKGTLLNDVMNQFMQGSVSAADPPRHGVLKDVMMTPLKPRALREYQAEIRDEAQALVTRLCAKQTFNAATELAQYLPLKIVTNKVGLPAIKQDRMIEWTPAAFNAAGPLELERTRAAFPVLEEINGYLRGSGIRDQIREDSWLGALYGAADRGVIEPEQCPGMSFGYVGPAVDTTASATAAAIYLFARNPDQWDRIRAQPGLIPNAINEIIRLECPIQFLSRVSTEDVRIEDALVPKGARVLLMFGSANRDEDRWQDAQRFNVARQASGQLGFGFGEHACIGANLARMEIAALLTALAREVRRFELTEEPRLSLNNTARIWRHMPVKLELR